MALVSASELAALLMVTPTRVSQYVREGKLNGCFLGNSRSRRFDVDKVANALGRQLHPGQMLGNGASTRKALTDLKAPEPTLDDAGIGAGADAASGELAEGRGGDDDPSRYEIARIHKAEEEIRKLRRQNAEFEGRYVLASEVDGQVSRLIAQEMAELEAMLRNCASTTADKLGLDVRAVRIILMKVWREHRSSRATVIDDQASEAEMTTEEKAADI